MLKNLSCLLTVYGLPNSKDCPEFWHFNAATNACELSNLLFDVQCQQDGVKIIFSEDIDLSEASIFGCDSDHFELDTDSNQISVNFSTCATPEFLRDRVVVRNRLIFGKEEHFLPIECTYMMSNDVGIQTAPEISDNRLRRSTPAKAIGNAFFTVNLEYFDRKFEKILEPEKALTVGEYANVEISLDQKIKGIELGLSNCTVFGEGENDSFGVVDYPGCPDKIVKASIFDGESQWERRLSYRVFEFVSDSLAASVLRLACRAVICDSNDQESECKKQCSSGATRRYLPSSK